jgi:hypothetical protein
MPNQENFVSSTSVQSKYTVSRIIANKADTLLEMEIPATFPTDLLESNVEINLYSLADNSLIYADFISNKYVGAITIETLQYTDGTFRKLLFIDFSKITEMFIPLGQYSVTLNFFVDEIGSYDNKTLKITKISPSRTEVELLLTNKDELAKLNRFVIPTIPAKYIVNVMKQIFNQDGALELEVPTNKLTINGNLVFEALDSGSADRLQTFGFDVDEGSKPGVKTVVQNVLDSAYTSTIDRINTDISMGTGSFTSEKINSYVLAAIDVAYTRVFNEVKTNPVKYRFNLL